MNIAVMCAPQTFGCNTGMLSVDLAAWYFIRTHLPTARTRFFTLYPPRCPSGGAIPFVYEDRAAFYAWEAECDVILYWGDFLHGLSYRNAVINRLLKLEPEIGSGGAVREVRRFLYRTGTSGSEPPTGAVVLYGGTLLFNQWGDYADAVYTDDLRRLLAHARAVWMREPFSAAAVQYWRRDYRSSAQGTDCALLLGWPGLQASGVVAVLRSPVSPAKRLGVFVGRSHVDAAGVAALLSGLEAALSAQAVWLNWGGAPFFFERSAEFYRSHPNMAPSAGEGGPLQALAALSSFDMVVSDTYHVCVNAWGLGIPAVCLIDDTGTPLGVNQGGQAGRDKRVVFYWSYHLSPFLVYASSLTSKEATQRCVGQLVGALADVAALSLALDAIRQHRAAGGGQLLEALCL